MRGLGRRLDLQIVSHSVEEDFVDCLPAALCRLKNIAVLIIRRVFRHDFRGYGCQRVSPLDNAKLDVRARAAPFHLIIAWIQEFPFDFGFFIQMHGLFVGVRCKGSQRKE